jgi:hypothetical protein
MIIIDVDDCQWMTINEQYDAVDWELLVVIDDYINYDR